MEKVVLFINNFNRFTWPKDIVHWCEGTDFEPIILDNASTYPPLLEWYKSEPCRVIRLDANLGPYALLAQDHLIRDLESDLFALTDPDLDLSKVPKDAFHVLLEGLQAFPEVTKAGLSLEIQDLPDTSIGNQAKAWEKQWWISSTTNRFFTARVDTTFALYDRKRLPEDIKTFRTNDYPGFLRAVRAPRPYTARHLPWYAIPEDLQEENEFYLESVRHQTHWTSRR